METATKERPDHDASTMAARPVAGTAQTSTWSEAKRNWRAQTKAGTPARRRRRPRTDMLQRLLDLQHGSNPWVTLGGAFLAWSTVVVLTLSLLEVIHL